MIDVLKNGNLIDDETLADFEYDYEDYIDGICYQYLEEFGISKDHIKTETLLLLAKDYCGMLSHLSHAESLYYCLRDLVRLL